MKRRILVVDDQESVLNVTASLVKALGFEVLTSSRPKEAMEIIKENSLCALVTDFHMPEIDGVDLAWFFRESHPGAPVVIFSGYIDETRKKAEESGIIDDLNVHLIPKPMEMETLKRLLTNCSD